MDDAEIWLNRNLKEVFAIPDDARAWLLALWNLIQVFDDCADGDPVDRASLDRAILDSIVRMHENQFFAKHSAFLLPLLSVAILKWKASDDVERAKQANEVSFVWRAGFYDIVLAVVMLIHGHEKAMMAARDVMRLYGESYADYVKEFPDA